MKLHVSEDEKYKFCPSMICKTIVFLYSSLKNAHIEVIKLYMHTPAFRRYCLYQSCFKLFLNPFW